MARTIRERPRYAFFLGLGLVAIVALAGLAGFLIAGTGDSENPGPSAREVRQAQQLRALRVELSEARNELVTAREELDDAAAATGRQRARAEGWQRRAQRLESRNQALRQDLREAQQQE